MPPAIVNTLINPAVLEAMMLYAFTSSPGCFVEVGVHKGGSAYCLGEVAKAQERDLYLYDTFTGIPYADDGDSHKVGDFSDTSVEEITALIPQAKVFQGVFPHSANPEMRGIAFAHIDCDQYRAVRESALYLSPLMVKGGVMWFDDYNCLPSAKRAVDELFLDRIELVLEKAMARF